MMPLTRLAKPGQGAHETRQAILVDKAEKEALVIIAQRPDDIVVGRRVKGKHAVLTLPTWCVWALKTRQRAGR